MTAGEAKGRRLVLPPRTQTRPTSAKLRAAVFSSLADVEGLRVADLYAGSGVLGIEALSRGAASATFVESNRDIAGLIGRNLEAASFAGRGTVVVDRVERFISRGQRFDLILADPPYGQADLESLVRGAVLILVEGGRLVLEHSSRQAPPPAPSGASLLVARAHGDSAFAIYRRAGTSQEGADSRWYNPPSDSGAV